MDRKKSALALLIIFFLIIFSFPLVVGAVEGDEDLAPETGDESSDIPPVSEPDPPVDITPEPPPEQTPEPPDESDLPSEDPTPSVDPSDSPEPSDSSEEDPSSSESPAGTATEAPIETPPPSSPPRNEAAAGVRPVLTSRPISTPRPSISRTKVEVQTTNSASVETTPSGSNYVTFAKVNIRNNSLAATLFYSGSGCVALGVLGLIVLLVVCLRGRKYRTDEVQNEVLGQIQEAEIRNRMAASTYRKDTAPLGEAPLRSAPPPRKETPLVPMATDLYTDEFSLPDAPPVSEAPNSAKAQSDSVSRSAPPPQKNAPAQPVPSPKKKTSFDTEEILKEFLPRD